MPTIKRNLFLIMTILLLPTILFVGCDEDDGVVEPEGSGTISILRLTNISCLNK